MIVAIVLASVAVLAAVVLLAMGKGGALSEVHPDHPPLTFSPDRPFDPDAPLPPLPHGLWGYHVKITDEALGRLVRALAERDERITLLEQQLLRFGSERGMGGMEPYGDAATDRVTDPATEPAIEPATEPVTEPATEPVTGAAGDRDEPAASTMPDFIGGQAPYAAPPAQATSSPYGAHYDAEQPPYAEQSPYVERSPFAPPVERHTEPSASEPSYGDVPPGTEEPPRARWWLDSAPSPEPATDDESVPRHEVEDERGWAPVDRPEPSEPTGWTPRSAYQGGPAGVPSGGWGDEPGPASPPTAPRRGSQGGGDEPAGHDEKPGGSDPEAPRG